MNALPLRVRRASLCCFLVACGAQQSPRAAELAELAEPPAGMSELEPAHTAAARNPLVLSVVIDQLGSSTLERIEPLLSPEGIVARARAQGRVYLRVVYPYAATLTAPGHVAIYSGATPSESGITDNWRFDRQSGQALAFVDDRKHAVHGMTKTKYAAPTLLRVDTVADVLKQASAQRAKVVSLALKDRSAIFPAGHTRDVVLFYETELPGFTTSAFYADALPQWVADFNFKHLPDLNAVWSYDEERRPQLENLGPDAAPGEGPPPGWKSFFPHRALELGAWLLTPPSIAALVDLALASREPAGLCTDAVPDLLAVSISTTDLVGHSFGPSSWEYAESLRHADLEIARLVRTLEEHCEVSVLVTSDHGVAPMPAEDARIKASELPCAIEDAARAAVGAPKVTCDPALPDRWVAYDLPYLWLSAAARNHKEAAKLRAAVLAAARRSKNVALAIDAADPNALEGSTDPVAQKIRLALHPDNSGDIFIVPREGSVPSFGKIDTGTTHGSPHAYDTDVPALVIAPSVGPAVHLEAFDQRRVASTLAALLRVTPPHPHAPEPLPGVSAK
jgi:predicted AlkP superfamily pyrophosphatase or phosphodiesterase